MHYFISYKGNQNDNGCPHWVDAFYPLIDEEVDLDNKYQNRDKSVLPRLMNSEVYIKSQFIDFDYFDYNKKIIIVSEGFLKFSKNLNCDFPFVPITIKTMDSKRKYVNWTRKKYFIIMIDKIFDCIDYVNSEYELDRDTDGNIIHEESGMPKIKHLYHLIVDSSRTCGEAFFYSFNPKGKVVCSEDFYLKFSKLNFKGIALTPTIAVNLMDVRGFEKNNKVIDKVDPTKF